MGDKNAEIANTASSKRSQTIEHIFSYHISQYTREVCLRLLRLYHQRPKPDESWTGLLGRLRILETTILGPERKNIAAILKNGVEARKITKRLIVEGVRQEEKEKKRRKLQQKKGQHDFQIKKPEQEQNVLIDCEVCMDALPKTKFPSHKITNGCAHEVNICLECLKRSIDVQCQDMAFDQIYCLAQGCAQKIDEAGVKMYASHGTWTRYHHLAVRRMQEKDPNFVWCQNPTCREGQMNYGRNAMAICNFCTFATCSRHNTPWHIGQSCEEIETNRPRSEQQKQDDAASEELLRKEGQQCPNCGIYVMKVSGCNNMHCRVCGVDFIWNKPLVNDGATGKTIVWRGPHTLEHNEEL